MNQPSLRHLLPFALFPFAASASAQISATCAPTASSLIVEAGRPVTLSSNCTDVATGIAIPSGTVNWEAVVGGSRQAIGSSSLPNGTLTVTAPDIPGDVLYVLVSGDAGYGGPITISQTGGSESAGASVTVNVACSVPVPVGVRTTTRARTHIVGSGATCNTTPDPTAPTQASLGQVSAPLLAVQGSRILNNLDQASTRMRALRASRSTALLDLQGIPLPQGVGDDGGNGRRERFGVYVTGLGDTLRQDGTATQAEFKSRTTSLSIGADYRLNDEWAMGGNVGYSSGKVDFTGSASEQKSKGTQATAYAAWSVTPTTYLSATLSYEADRFDVTRDDGNQQLSTSTPKGHGLGLSVAAGRDFVTGPWSIGPYVRWDNVTSSVDAFDESGSAAAVSVGAQRVKSNALNAGVQTQFSVPVSWGILLPYVRVELTHRSDKTTQAATATLINGNTTLLVPTAADTGGTYGNVAFGLAGVNQGGASWFADYETGIAQKGYRTRRIGLGLRFEL